MKTTTNRTLRTLTGVLLAASLAEAAVDLRQLPPPAAKQGVTYTNDIKPILDKSCVQCHGPEKQKAKLRLDSLADALKGAGKHKIIVPGNSVKSELVIAISRLDEDFAMPPEGKADPLTKEQVGLVRAWIDQGAK